MPTLSQATDMFLLAAQGLGWSIAQAIADATKVALLASSLPART